MSVEEGGEAQQTVEEKLDVLSASVDKRFNAVDENFKAVTAALVEQREYTEFAFGRLEARLDRIDHRMDARFGKVDGRFARLERKLDQIIDLQVPKTPPGRSDAE